MKPQSAKSKGRRLQQKVASSIRDAFPHLQEDDCFSTSMGANGEDVRMSPLARESVPLSIECKCQEKLNVWSCLEQANSNCPKEATPCLVFSRNRANTFAVVPWDFLLKLLVETKANAREHMDPALQRTIRELVRFLPDPPHSSSTTTTTMDSTSQECDMSNE